MSFPLFNNIPGLFVNSFHGVNKPPDFGSEDLVQWTMNAPPVERDGKWWFDDKTGDQRRDVFLGGYLSLQEAESNSVDTGVNLGFSANWSEVTLSGKTDGMFIAVQGTANYDLLVRAWPIDGTTLGVEVIYCQTTLFYNATVADSSDWFDIVIGWAFGTLQVTVNGDAGTSAPIIGTYPDTGENFFIKEASAGKTSCIKDLLVYLNAVKTIEYDFEGIDIGNPIVYDKSGNGNNGTILGTLTDVYKESIKVKSYRNLYGYNKVGDTYVPRLETSANLDLPIKEQEDVLGNTLEFYGRCKYDMGVVDNSIVVGNGADNIIETDVIIKPSTTMIIKGRFTSLFPGVQRIGAYSDGYRFYIGISNHLWEFGNGAYNITGVADTLVHEFKVQSGGKCYIDGVEIADLGGIGVNLSIRLPLLAELYLGGVYAPSTFAVHYCKIYENDVLVRDFNFSESAGSYVYDKVSGDAYLIQGDLTSVHATSEYQKPYNLLEGFDRWTKAGADDIYVPIGVTCVETGYTYSETVQPIAKGIMDCDSKLLQPQAPQLYDVDVAMGGNPWYASTNQASKSVPYSTVVADYNDKHQWFADVTKKAPEKFNSLVYLSAQSGDTLTKILKYIHEE
jgi:hypothetical protein